MAAIEIEKEDSTLMTKEDFFDRLDKAEKEIAEGKGVTFTNKKKSLRVKVSPLRIKAT